MSHLFHHFLSLLLNTIVCQLVTQQCFCLLLRYTCSCINNHCTYCRCNGAVDFLLDWDKEARYRLAALQSKAGRDLLQQAGRHPDDLSSIVLVEPGQAYIKSEAVLRIGQRLNTPFYALGSMGLPVPSLIRDSVYDMVSCCICL